MIVVDSSALVAILRREPEADRFTYRIYQEDRALVAAPTALEVVMVMTGRADSTVPVTVSALLRTRPLEIVAWRADDFDLAQRAFLRFGKGRHAAGLNFGDCIAYALARRFDLPLLFKGTDFGATDVRAA
jgi:ribonuclease VapC